MIVLIKRSRITDTMLVKNESHIAYDEESFVVKFLGIPIYTYKVLYTGSVREAVVTQIKPTGFQKQTNENKKE